ncbi:unnamed protein product, partial [Larinioides sclopetarius]
MHLLFANKDFRKTFTGCSFRMNDPFLPSRKQKQINPYLKNS